MATERDLIAIVTDGCICPPEVLPFHMATSGLLVPLVLVVIEIPGRGGEGGESFGYLLTDDKDKEDMAKKLAQIQQDDEDIMLIIQIFVMKWL